MKNSILGAAILATLIGLGGCASRAESVGTFGGAALGAGLNGGTIGTLGGAMVGYAAGRAYDERNR